MTEGRQQWQLDLAVSLHADPSAGFTHQGTVTKGWVRARQPGDAPEVTGDFRITVDGIGGYKLALSKIEVNLQFGNHQLWAQRSFGLVDLIRTSVPVYGKLRHQDEPPAKICLQIPIFVLINYLINLNLPDGWPA